MERDKDAERPQPIGDVFDIFDSVTTIHTKGMKEITRDHVFANYNNSEIIDQKLPKFIREQMAVTRVAGDYLLLSKDKIKRFYGNRIDKKFSEVDIDNIHSELAATTKKACAILQQETNLLAIMSRDPQGKYVEIALKTGNPELDKETLQEEGKKGLMGNR